MHKSWNQFESERSGSGRKAVSSNDNHDSYKRREAFQAICFPYTIGRYFDLRLVKLKDVFNVHSGFIGTSLTLLRRTSEMNQAMEDPAHWFGILVI